MNKPGCFGRKLALLLLSASLVTGCKKGSPDEQPGFIADVHIVAPFTNPAEKDGKLYLSKGHLRVDFGPMADVYDIKQKRGWRLFPDSKQYTNIGWKDVSTYLPQMTNASPCPNSVYPSDCNLVDSEIVNGRPSTKWAILNQHRERIYLWTDDRLEIALKWQIENVTYDANNIRAAALASRLFELPSGYTPLPRR